MSKRYELTGKVFGRLSVLEFAGIGNAGHSWWLCRCECGTEKVIRGFCLVRETARSCGCKQGGRNGLFGSVKRTHGMSKTRPYQTWLNLRLRCGDPANQDYRNYGGRGIRVCQEWEGSFDAFWRDMGATYVPGLTIDRINTNGHYEAANCRWVPMSEQWKTRRSHGPKRAPNEPSAAT